MNMSSGPRLGPALQQQQKAELSLTPELQQAIAMLGLGAAEIQDYVAREVGDNPCLEYEDHADTPATPEASAENTKPDAEENWDSSWDEWAMRDEGSSGPMGEMYAGSARGGESEDNWFENIGTEESLQAYLTHQFEEVVTDAKLRLAGRFLIDGLDDAGYLRLDMEALAAQLRLSPDLIDDARAILQTLEPSGIGARDLAECLRLQLHARGQLETVTETCIANLDLVATRQFARLAELARIAGATAADEDEIRLAIVELQHCNPKPAMTLGLPSQRIETVIPDLLVQRDAGGQWHISLNGAAFPRLMTLPPAQMDGVNKGQTEARKYLAERHGRAKWLVGALEQRARSTLAVGQAILAAQPTFFEAGAEFLVPLTLRQVATEVGLHESTVSRVVSGKFMQTPYGVLPLRQFFASGVASVGGQEGVAARSVQGMIARLVKAEDPRKPLSDEAIVTKLKEEGVVLARRTVAKYRGILNIPGTAERRVRSSHAPSR